MPKAHRPQKPKKPNKFLPSHSFREIDHPRKEAAGTLDRLYNERRLTSGKAKT